MTTSEDLYALLEVAEDADPSQIKKSYHQMARKWHPDKNNGNEQVANINFQKINEAYDILKDPVKRKAYDNQRKQAKMRNRNFDFPRTTMHTPRSYMSHAFRGHDDVFFSFFDRPRKCKPISIIINISLQEAYTGTRKSFSIPVHKNNEIFSQDFWIDIPPGIEDQETIILNNQGNSYFNCEDGDVIATIRIAPHPIFQRKGSKLFMNVSITLKESLCGFEKELIGIDGKSFIIKIDTLTKPGDIGVQQNLGMPIKNSKRYDDLILNFLIIYPKEFPKDVREILVELLPD